MMASPPVVAVCCAGGAAIDWNGESSKRRGTLALRRGLMSLGPTVAMVVFFLNAVTLTSGLRDVRISVPEAVRRGEIARLSCDYDLEMTPLYSIKWYKGDEEFYRFVPKEAPPTQVFPLPGISVDVSQSNAKEVHLNDVQMALSDVYKCEVSADAPFFHTDIKSAPMVVVDFPDELPVVSTEKRKYAPGERIRANCSSPPSYPPANLTWFLNGQEVPAHAVIPYPVSIFTRQIVEEETEEPEAAEKAEEKPERRGGSKWTVGGKPISEVRKRPSKPKPTGPPLETSVVGLDLDPESASEHLYPRDGGGPRLLTLRCLATLFGLYRRAAEVHLMAEDSPKIASVVLGASRKDAGATVAAAAAHGPSPAHPSLHHSGTMAMSARSNLSGALLMALINVFATVRASGWR